jgi:hypothetical protein
MVVGAVGLVIGLFLLSRSRYTSVPPPPPPAP